jgi:hypothetical protein
LRKCCKEEDLPEPSQEKPVIIEEKPSIIDENSKENFFVDLDDVIVNRAESERLDEEKEPCIPLIINESDNKQLNGELNFDKRTEEELKTPKSDFNKDYYDQNFNNGNNINFKPIFELERKLNLDRFSDEENDVSIEIDDQKKSDIDHEEKLDFDHCSKALDYDLHNQQIFQEKEPASIFNSALKSPETNNTDKEEFKEEGTPNSNQPNTQSIQPVDSFSIDPKMTAYPQRQLRVKRTPTDYYLG